MNKEHIPVITDREELYDKCENMEQLFDKYYLPLLDKHYSKTYKLQQENQELKKENKILRENAEHNDKVVDKVNWENQSLKKQLEEKENIACNWKDSCLENAGKMDKLENQQKEFIKYLEYQVKLQEELNDIHLATGFEEILSKYQEIIGEDK